MLDGWSQISTLRLLKDTGASLPGQLTTSTFWLNKYRAVYVVRLESGGVDYGVSTMWPTCSANSSLFLYQGVLRINWAQWEKQC